VIAGRRFVGGSDTKNMGENGKKVSPRFRHQKHGGKREKKAGLRTFCGGAPAYRPYLLKSLDDLDLVHRAEQGREAAVHAEDAVVNKLEKARTPWKMICQIKSIHHSYPKQATKQRI
jgi:hypothetical protein